MRRMEIKMELTSIGYAFEMAFHVEEFWIEDDGGLSRAPDHIKLDPGLKGNSIRAKRSTGADNCVFRAIAIAFDLEYEEVWLEIKGEKERIASYGPGPDIIGCVSREFDPILERRGWCRYDLRFRSNILVRDVHLALRSSKSTRILLLAQRHMIAYKEGQLRDSWNSAYLPMIGMCGPSDERDALIEHLNNLGLLRSTKNEQSQ